MKLEKNITFIDGFSSVPFEIEIEVDGYEASNKQKQDALNKALLWEKSLFEKHKLGDCDRWDDSTPRFAECDFFIYQVTDCKEFGILMVIGRIFNKQKYRKFLENKPKLLPNFTPSEACFWN